MITTRIGIVSFNTADLLDRCLAALPAATAGLTAEIVVVDNASSDGSADVARRHPGVTVIANGGNVGYARAMNQALNAGNTAPEVLIALNPDTVPPPGSLTGLAEQLRADPGLGLVVPRLVNEDGSLQHSVYRFPSLWVTLVVAAVPARFQRGRLARRFWLDGRTPHDEACDIDWAIGAVHAIRTAALAGHTPYSERWFMYVEDVDLCWQLGRGGWRRRLVPDIEVAHVGNASGEQHWGEGRTARWWEATYDWYRLRHGVAAARRWAALNTVSVTLLSLAGKVRRRLGRGSPALDFQIAELGRALPVHRRMLRSARTAYVPAGVSDDRSPGAP